MRGLYREKLDGGLAPRTVLHIHRTLSKALKQAVMDGLVPRNAAAPVKPPRPRREEIRPLNREQVRALFVIAGNPLSYVETSMNVNVWRYDGTDKIAPFGDHGVMVIGDGPRGVI